MSSTQKTYRPETRLVHAGTLRSQFGETSEALFLTQGYVYPSAEECEARFSGKTPGLRLFALLQPDHEHVREAHGGARRRRGRALDRDRHGGRHHRADGPGQAGDHVVAAKALFGSCRWVIEEWLPRFGVTSTLVDGIDLGAWKKAVRKNTKVFFMETPTNPTLEVYDIAAVAEIAHEAGAKLVVDNVFATPLYQSPLTLGADCVVYSATKHIDGQGRVLGGVILASEKLILDHYHQLLRQTGPSLSPFNAWVLLKGLETLAAARRAADRERRPPVSNALAGHKKISRLIYPGRADHPQAAVIAKQMKAGSTLCSFEIKGGKEGAFRFLNALAARSASPTISATPRAWSRIRPRPRISG